MSEERRANPNPFDIAGMLAILYTIGYLGMCALLYYVTVPLSNEKPLLVLFGVMSSIQLQLIGFYYGGSKQVEAQQRATEQRQGRSAAVVEEIAKAAAPVAAAAVAAATGAPAPIPAPDAATMKTGTVNIEADIATLTEKESKP